ncbi:MAG: class I SAM-dependent methyltransferase [Candidatus Krumholzibacteria bacterium]|nr:class I SAM-dependent methyltransferase [Candidatus Krumholzibacteria bacterium]
MGGDTKMEQKKTVTEKMAKLARKGKLTAKNADLHWLYEKSVQNAEVEVGFINEVYEKTFGHKPISLREDFCGTANLCAEWIKLDETKTALGVDYDEPTLQWGRENNLAPLGERAQAVTLIRDDVRNVRSPQTDVLAATNFSWWGFKTRDQLAGYLRNCHASLKDEGMMLMDCYGGPEAQIPQEEEREQDGFDYIWDQDTFNPITNEITCYIDFNFKDGSQMKKAFSYDWRLWSLPETCDLLKECGFSRAVVYWEGTDEDGEPDGEFQLSLVGDLAPAWVAYIMAFK